MKGTQRVDGTFMGALMSIWSDTIPFLYLKNVKFFKPNVYFH